MPQVEYEVRDRVAYITMNRPEKLNAMSHEMLQGLWDAFTNLLVKLSVAMIDC